MAEAKSSTENEDAFGSALIGVSKKATDSLSISEAIGEKENPFKLVRTRIEIRLIEKVVESQSFFRFFGEDIIAKDTMVILVGNNVQLFNTIGIGETFSLSGAIVYPKSRLLVLGSHAQVRKTQSDVQVTAENNSKEDRQYFIEYPFWNGLVGLEYGQLVNVQGRITTVETLVQYNFQNTRSGMLPFWLEMDNGANLRVTAWQDMAHSPWIEKGKLVRLYGCLVSQYQGEFFLKMQKDAVVEVVEPLLKEIETNVEQNVGCCMSALETIGKFFRCCKK